MWSFVDQLVEHGACTTRAVGLIPGTTEMYVCMTVNRFGEKCLLNGVYIFVLSLNWKVLTIPFLNKVFHYLYGTFHCIVL